MEVVLSDKVQGKNSIVMLPHSHLARDYTTLPEGIIFTLFTILWHGLPVPSYIDVHPFLGLVQTGLGRWNLKGRACSVLTFANTLESVSSDMGKVCGCPCLMFFYGYICCCERIGEPSVLWDPFDPSFQSVLT
jgi:hypothetical protein